MENTSADPHVPVIKSNTEDMTISPPSKKRQRYDSFIWKNRSLAIFVVAFALIGGYILINSFAASVSFTKVWSTASDWRTGTLSNTSIVGNTVELAANPTPITTNTTNTSSNAATATKAATLTTSAPSTSGGTLVGTANTDLAVDRQVTASSTASTNTSGFFGWFNHYFGQTSQYNPPSNAVDGSTTTRWASQSSSPQWIYVDLRSTYNISEVKLDWYTDYAKAYQVQVSSNASTWTTIYTTSTNNGGVNDLTSLSGSGRYVRIYATQPATSNGYSLWEMYVYGTLPSTTPTPTPTLTPTTTTPTVSFSANPTTVTQSTDPVSTLTWSSTGATSCTASGGWTGTKAVSGSASVSLSQTTTYNLSCAGTGGTATKSVTVTYSPPVTAPAVTYVSSGNIILTFDAGSGVSWASLTPTTTLPTGTNITYQIRTSSNDSSWSSWSSYSVTAKGALDLSSLPSTRYIQVQSDLTTSNSANTPILSGLTLGYNSVIVTPTVTFSANPTTISAGAVAESTLTWSSSGTTSCTASGGWSGAEATSGSVSVNVGQTTTYNISCSGAGGTASGSATVTDNNTTTEGSFPCIAGGTTPTTNPDGSITYTSCGGGTVTTSPPTSGSGSGTGTPTGPTAGTVLFDDEFNGAAGPFFPGGSTISSDGQWHDNTGCSLNGAACNDTAADATLDGNGHLDLRISWDSSLNEYDGAFISTFDYSGWPPPASAVNLQPPYEITMSAEMPNVSSAWPGLWLMDVNHSQAQGDNEIDVAEDYGSNTTASCNQHFWVNSVQTTPSDITAAELAAGDWGSNGFSCGTASLSDVATAFNTYTADVYSDHVVYYFGGKEVASVHGTLGTDGSVGFQGILLDVNMTSAPPAGGGPWDMLVDYVKVTAL